MKHLSNGFKAERATGYSLVALFVTSDVSKKYSKTERTPEKI